MSEIDPLFHQSQLPADFLSATHEIPFDETYGALSAVPNLEERLQELETHVRTFPQEAGTLPDSVVRAFSPQTIPLFLVGLPQQDGITIRHTLVQRVQALNNYAMLLDQTYTPDGRVRPLYSPTNNARKHMKNSVSHIESQIGAGLSGISGVNTTLGPIQLIYRKEADPVWEDTQLLGAGLKSADKTYLYDPFDPVGLTSDDLSTDLRHAHPPRPDIQGQLLSARFDTFLGLLHPGMGTTILAFLAAYGAVNRTAGSIADGLAAQFRETVLGDDMSAKLQALEQIQQLFGADAQRTQSEVHRRFFSTSHRYLEKLLSDVYDFTGFFRNVYDGLGEPEHPYFAKLDAMYAANEAEPVPAAASYVGHTAVASTEQPAPSHESDEDQDGTIDTPPPGDAPPAGDTPPPKDVVPPEVIAAEIAALQDTLQTSVDSYEAEWRLSNKQRKNLQLNSLYRALTSSTVFTPPAEGIGFESQEVTTENIWEFVGLPTDYVDTMLGVVMRLAEASPEDVPIQLAQAAAARQELFDAQTILHAYAKEREHDHLVRIHVSSPAECLQRIADNWHIFVRIFDESGPEGFAGDVWRLLPEPTPGSPYQRLRDARPPTDFGLHRAASNSSSVSGAEMVE